MSDWQPQVVKIESVDKHPAADKLDIVKVLGDYPVIVKRDEYKVGDISWYIPIDSIVPDTEDFYFLCPKAYKQYEEDGAIKNRQIGNKYQLGSVPEKYRVIRAKKILNIYSQGMLVKPKSDLEIGSSIIEILSLKKMEEENEENIVNVPGFKKLTACGNSKKSPQGWSIPYYDIDSIRKYVHLVEKQQDIILLEKIEGANFSACYDGKELWVKSRRFYKENTHENMWWDIATRYNLEEKLKKYPFMIFFGEVAGQVKKFRYGSKIENGMLKSRLFIFDIKDVKNDKYIDYDEMIKICKELELDTAPLLYRGPWTTKEEMYSYAEGNSLLDSHIREGWVLRLGKENYEPKISSRVQYKLVGEGYNLQK